MKTYKYSTHSISRCYYIYPILDVNVETNYVKPSSGFSRVNQIVNNLPDDIRIEIPEVDKHEATLSELSGYFEVEFELKRIWNILVVTDSNKIPLSIIYDDYALNTNEVDTIYLKYTINYDSNSIDIDLNIGTEYLRHINEYVGTNMQPIPKMLSRTSEYSITNWSDENFEMNYESDILNDNESSYNYLLKIPRNSNIIYDSSSKYYLTGSTQDLFIIKVDSNLSAKVYPLNPQDSNVFYNLGTLPTSDICHIESLENGLGYILVDNSNNIYYSKLLKRNYVDPNNPGDPVTEYSSWYGPINLTDYSLLVPTFIDLCGCYVKLPNPSTKTPTAYQVRKWTALFDESDSFGDKIYAGTYDYPDTKAPGDYRLELGYWDSLGISNPKAYFRSSGISQDSPVSMHQFDSMSPTEGNCNILDMNLRVMTCLYVDLLNNGRLRNRVIPRDCGLEFVNTSGGNDFVTYTGTHYKLPEGANITNMCYYINTENDSKIVSLIDGKVQELDSPILCTKYGIVITKSMLEA